MQLFLALAAASAYTVGGVFMKQSAGLTRPLPGLMVFVTFLIGAALQALSMRQGEMSRNLLTVLGAEAALALALGMALFGERMTTSKALGVVLVVAGAGLLRRP